MRPQNSSFCAPQHRICRWDPGDLKALVWKKSRKQQKKVHTCKTGVVSVLVHAQRALHTPCSAHCSHGTLVDRRNGQKGMLGTRITHVLCPWWKSLFAAMVRETVSEGGDEHFSANWHGFLRGRRREGAMLAQRCMRWRLTSLGKSHLNSITDMNNAFPCTKRETMEEANEQMFKGDLWTTKLSGLPAGTRRRTQIHGETWAAHGDTDRRRHASSPGPSTRPSNDGN